MRPQEMFISINKVDFSSYFFGHYFWTGQKINIFNL